MTLFIMMNLNILYFFLIIVGSIISISSLNWLGAWMGLELNMLSFIPLISSNKNILSNESAIKYFLIQAIASASFLVMCLLNSFNSPIFSNFMFMELNNALLILPLMLKLGAAPFQSWFIMTMQGMNWFKCFILMTWQKIAPMFLLFYILWNKKMVLLFSVLSLLVGTLGGLNQTNIKKIMAYSSINHIGWLISTIMLNKYMLMFYFIFYSLLNLFVVSNLNNNIMYFNQMFFNTNKNSFMISFLSMAGLPPLIGFMPKWFILMNLVNESMMLLSIIMIFTALISIYFYMRLIYTNLIMLNTAQKWHQNSKYNWSNNTIFMVTLIGLFMFNLILN